ncbi:MAG: LPS export ABC transporter permease LptG [Geobacteraceae bacterium GWC2_55_20]|nr:MAG: LPS export ABC transporter permease LptG [Geobacteraceae bacterium GWC2_55_20]OGU22677.1 MAG: LPS export ABC transporter permease LptG [Geobacteraceae bacterium GWF2_54_21]HCE66944.1 LPS export ABC transporter permease LptG [Geobacter sp.]
MLILNRYIAFTWLRLFALCLGSFVAIYLVLDMMDKIPRYLRAGGAISDIATFFLNKLPEMVGQTAAFSTLMATLLTLGLLSRSSEITAMRSCGISLLRISFPMLMLGLVASVLLLVNAEMLVPKSYERMDYIERVRIKKQGVNAVFKLNNIWFRNDSMIIQARAFDPQKRMLKGVTVWTMDDSLTPVSRIDADRAEFKDGHWTLRQLEVKDFSVGTGYRATAVPSMEVALNLKVDDLKVLDNNADNLSYRKLREYAENLRRGGYQAFRYMTMMHSKISSPFAAFVMVVLGIPFAMRNSRSGGIALGIGASVGIGFGYFVINAVLLSYGRSGVLPAVAAAWGANVIFCLVGVWLAMTVKR